MLVLNTSDDIEMSTPGTDALLDLLRSSDPVPRTLPASVLIIAAQTRAAAKGGRQPTPLNGPAAHGWITLHGSVPTGPPGRVAVVIQTTPENEAAPLRLETFALSQREREIAALIAQDLDTASIAERLFISPWTVQDHCKAIFERPPRTPDASSVPSCSSTTICRRSSYEHRSTPAATSRPLRLRRPLSSTHPTRHGPDKTRKGAHPRMFTAPGQHSGTRIITGILGDPCFARPCIEFATSVAHAVPTDLSWPSATHKEVKDKFHRARAGLTPVESHQTPEGRRRIAAQPLQPHAVAPRAKRRGAHEPTTR